MSKFNKIIVVLFSSFFLSLAVNSTEVKFGHVGKPGSLFSASVDHFAKLANERLGSKGKVSVFGSSQLGKDKQGMQKLKLGTVNMWLPSSVMASIPDIHGAAHAVAQQVEADRHGEDHHARQRCHPRIDIDRSAQRVQHQAPFRLWRLGAETEE